MKNTLIINPIYFFTFGFFYYLIVPFLSFIFIDDFYQFTPLEASLKYINFEFFNLYYLLDLIFIYLFFIIGYKLAFFINTSKKNYSFDVYSSSNGFNLILFLIVVILLSILIGIFLIDGNVFFTGYKKTFDIEFLGQLSTLTVITVFLLIFTNIQKYKFLFIFLFIVEVILLLSLGSRNIFVNGMITIFLYLIYNNSSLLKNYKFYIVIVFLVFIVLYIGIWRTGYEFKLRILWGIFLSEPMFVLVSAVEYFKTYGRELINLPYEIFLSIINFIPTFIYPEKLEIIKDTIGYKYNFSPFGASSIFVNLYSNFGIFYFAYIMFIGFYFSLIYRKSINSNFFRAIYFLTIPLMMFQFYNQFLFSFFKLLFWNGLALPILMIYSYSLIIKYKKF